VRYSKTDAGFAALSDVETKSKKTVWKVIFLAETLKYLICCLRREKLWT